MDLEIIILTKSNREKNYITDMWNLKKMLQMNFYTKQKQIHRHRNKLMVTKGERLRGGIN